MKVLILHPFLSSHYKNNLYNILYQKTLDESIEVVVLQFFRNESSRKEIFSINESELNYPYELLFDEDSEKVSSLKLFWKIFSRINFHQPQILNLSGFYSLAHILTFLYCQFRGIKVIISNDSTKIDNKNVAWKDLIKKYIVRNTDGFFCYGTRAVEYMKSLGATNSKILSRKAAVVDNKTIESVYNQAIIDKNIRKKAFGFSEKNFIYVGRFIEIKNLKQLILAFKNAQLATKDTQNWGLILLGGGIEKENLEQIISKNQIKNIHFIEGQKWYDVPKYLALADVFVLPSKSEPWGLVVNEAMVCKMPVLVSDMSGCSIDLVENDKNGYVFDTENSTDLVQKILKFMNNEVNLKVFGENSYLKIQQNSPENCADEMIKGFKKI